CAFGAVVTGAKPRFNQPFWNAVGMLVSFCEPSRWLLLNVSTFASQHSALVCEGGGGENDVGAVNSSRSKMPSATSSHEPAVLLKLRWNSLGAVPVPM